ncbi:hypothetical protein [Arthrobacter sp. USHLN218]|uniref:hypothetical protein n=1 Tax=Arthrobacter sp. USHLN218 TaxID=3081232 RepID=UPI0030185860
MIEALVFPDTRSAVFDLIHNSRHYSAAAGKLLDVRAAYHLPADNYGALLPPFPLAHIFPPVGTEGFVDRVERIVVEVYAPGEQAVQVLESVRASIVGTDLDTPSGYLDRIDCDVTPSDVPYQSDTLNKATMTLLVTSRPL